MTPEYFDIQSTRWDDEKKCKRAKTVYTRMADFIKADSAKKLLDFGSGTGLLGFNFIHDFSEVHFADTSARMLEKVSTKAHTANIKNYKTILLQGDELDGAAFAAYQAVVTLLAFLFLRKQDLQSSAMKPFIPTSRLSTESKKNIRFF